MTIQTKLTTSEMESTTTSGAYTVRCLWCPTGELSASNQTALLMGHGENESHENRLTSREVSRSEHTVVYCPDCGGTLLRFIEGGVVAEPEVAE